MRAPSESLRRTPCGPYHDPLAPGGACDSLSGARGFVDFVAVVCGNARAQGLAQRAEHGLGLGAPLVFAERSIERTMAASASARIELDRGGHRHSLEPPPDG